MVMCAVRIAVGWGWRNRMAAGNSAVVWNVVGGMEHVVVVVGNAAEEFIGRWQWVETRRHA